MYKKLVIASAVIGLTACGSSSSSGTTPNEGGGTDNTPAVIAGDGTETIYTTASSASATLTITDVDTDEASFNAQTDVATTYGTFSITEGGEWSYQLNADNADVLALTTGESLTDTITVSSLDGTTAEVAITIEYAELDPDELVVPTLPDGVLTVPTVSCTETFSSVSDLEDAATQTMTAGTTLCLADGVYSEDLQLKFGGEGTEAAPIKVAAATPGNVTFSGGEVSIKMGGSYTQLQGFIFEDVIFSSSLIETRFGTHDLCYNCRITENTVVNAVASGSSGIYAHIYGKDVWFDHNILSGKTVANPMVSLNRWVSSDWDEETQIAELAQGIVVYANYIANRPPADAKFYASNDDNDYEAIRTGLSDTHQYPGNSIVSGNLFENIQGEAEVISNKGSNNVITNNTVRNSYGSITNRHGNTNVISNNFMFGDGYPYAAGLRIVDDGHTITNNYIEGARYQNTSHHGGIVIIGSDGAGDSNNGYQQVENVHIAHNTVVDSVNSINIDGGGKSSQPKQVYFANNIVDKGIGDVFVDTDRGVSSDSYYSGNIVFGSGALADTDEVSATDLGATFMSAELAVDETGLYRPSDLSSGLAADTDYEKGDFSAVETDMDGTVRGDSTEVGADDVNDFATVNQPLTYADVGPSYAYEKPAAIMVEADIANADFEDGITSWSGGDIISTDDGAFAGNGLQISGTASATQAGIELTASTRYAVSAFVKGTYSLAVNEHVFEGEETSSDYSYVVHEFSSDADETSGTITLKLADQVVLDAPIVDADLGQFKTDGGKSDDWVFVEDSDAGLGDVGSSSDSAFNDDAANNGSARVRFKADVAVHDFTATPGLSQMLTEVPTGVDLTYGLYYCDKKGDDSLTTLHYGVKDSAGDVIAQSTAHVKDLEDAPEGSVKDCFKQVTLDLDNNTYTDMEIFAYIVVDTVNNSDDVIYASEQFTDDDLEVRLDEFSLTYTGAPDGDAVALFDEVRLVKRTIDSLSLDD